MRRTIRDVVLKETRRQQSLHLGVTGRIVITGAKVLCADIWDGGHQKALKVI